MNELINLATFSLKTTSNPTLVGAVTLVAGTNVTLGQSGQEITINASGGGGGSSGWLVSGTDTALDAPVVSATIGNNNKLILGNSGDAFLTYDTASFSTLVLASETTSGDVQLAIPGGFYMYANTGFDASGDWYPAFYLQSDGITRFENWTNGYVQIDSRSGFSSGFHVALQMQYFGHGGNYIEAGYDADGVDFSGSRVRGENLTIDSLSSDLALAIAGSNVASFDGDTTAGNTRFMLYDVDSGALQRVKVTSNNAVAGVTGRVLYVDNI